MNNKETSGPAALIIMLERKPTKREEVNDKSWTESRTQNQGQNCVIYVGDNGRSKGKV